VFSGNCLEKCSVSTDLNLGHVEELYSAMSNGEETSFQYKAGETQVPGNQPSKLAWLTQVDNDLERLMYPAEVTSLLMNASAKSVEPNGKWISPVAEGRGGWRGPGTPQRLPYTAI
jgi:hypothetical protein